MQNAECRISERFALFGKTLQSQNRPLFFSLIFLIRESEKARVKDYNEPRKNEKVIVNGLPLFEERYSIKKTTFFH